MANKLRVEMWNRETLIKMLYQAYNFELSHLDFKDNKDDGGIGNEEIDPLLMDAINLVVETQIVSTSFIQRRLKIGYAKAGNIIDQMEQRGIISGYQGSKPREVLMSKEKLEKIKMNLKEY